MIIRNDAERKEAGIPTLGYLCGACDADLNEGYPVIIVGDRKNTAYHLSCAALLVSEIADALSDYIGEMSQQNRQSGMEQAFREAVRQRRAATTRPQ